MHWRREALSRYVAEVQPDTPIGHLEIIQEIAAYRGDRLERVRDPDGADAQWLGRHHYALNRARFFQLFFAKLLYGEFPKGYGHFGRFRKMENTPRKGGRRQVCG